MTADSDFKWPQNIAKLNKKKTTGQPSNWFSQERAY